MRLAFFELEPWEEVYLKEHLKGHQLVFHSGKLDKHNAHRFKDVEGMGVFIYSYLNKDVLDCLPSLKFITTLSTGYDHIDIAECQKRKILVSNVPTYGENTVAEHTFALLLNISRKVYESVEQTRKGSFELQGLRGFDLKGKTIAVIGAGSIGMHVIRMALGFEMDVIAFERHPDFQWAKKRGFRYAKSLSDAVRHADIITLHLPLMSETNHIFDKALFKRCKKGVILINTARGGLVDTKSLLWALDKKIVAAAGLDVLEEECVIKEEKQLLSKHFIPECDLHTLLYDHILLQRQNVYITPHNAFNSKEALIRILNTGIENVDAFVKGKPIHLVLPAKT